MYSRRTSSDSPLRRIVGLIIIAGAIGAFAVFQATRPDTASATQTAIALAPTTTPTAPPTTTPKPVQYRIISDKARLSALITELYYATDSDNWDLTHLAQFAGHLQGTPNIGQGGNFVLAGHVELKDGSRGPFADVHSLAPGDPITIIGDTQPAPLLKQYIVTDEARVPPQDFGVMRNHGYEELTLITCDDWDPKAQTYSTRIIVHARPLGSIPKATATPPTKK